MKKVVVGGTFDPIHEGHKALLKKAFELGEVYIGLTSDEMVKHKGHEVRPYKERYENLKQFIETTFKRQAIIREINKPFGNTTSEHYDYIVVSPETYPIALKINQIRREKNLPPIEIIKIDFVLAGDGKPISSTRIREGKIGLRGELL